MTTSEFFLLALGVVFLWELYAMIFVNRTIKVRGSVPYRGPVMMIVCILFSAFYLYRWGVEKETVICVVAFVIVTLLFMVIRTGLTEYGVANNGNVLAYKKINYYSIEDGVNETNVRVRFNGTRRELVLLFPKEQEALVEAYMVKNEIPTLDGYRDKKKSSER